MAMDPVTAGLDFGKELIKRWWPDKEEQSKREADLYMMAANGDLQRFMKSVDVVIAEANSEHVITATWRPVVMLSFTALIVAHYMGFTAPNITAEEIAGLQEIIKFGLTGYVLGRSAEKGIKEWKK